MNEDSAPLVRRLPAPTETPRGFVLWVNKEEEASFKALRDRWNRVLGWTDAEGRSASDLLKEPTLRAMISEWKSFQDLWEHGDEDPDSLLRQSQNLTIIETRARDFGYDKPAGSVPTPHDPEKANPVLAGADEFFEGLEEAGVPVPSATTPDDIKRTAEKGAASLGQWWRSVPTGWKVGGVAGLVGAAAVVVNSAVNSARALFARNP